MPPEQDQPKTAAQSWMRSRLEALDALFQKFGPEGLREQPLADVHLLLASKEAAYRDAPKGRELPEAAKQANRMAEMEIKTLANYLNGVVAGAGLFGTRQPRAFTPQQQQQHKPKDKARDGPELER